MARIENVIFVDNSPKVLEELDKAVEFALRAVGEDMEGYSKKACPVDTGRLRNSITCKTREYQSPANTYAGFAYADSEEYAPRSTPDKHEVWIGTNVEYAAAQEFGDYDHRTGQSHYLQEASHHIEQYKSKIRQTLENW